MRFSSEKKRRKWAPYKQNLEFMFHFKNYCGRGKGIGFQRKPWLHFHLRIKGIAKEGNFQKYPNSKTILYSIEEFHIFYFTFLVPNSIICFFLFLHKYLLLQFAHCFCNTTFAFSGIFFALKAMKEPKGKVCIFLFSCGFYVFIINQEMWNTYCAFWWNS